ncbi:MAG: hypothetical protein PHH36_07900 [Sideroxydans sp.]|nr:hypothetical protein [Sideroxydans sp.]
MPTIPGLSASSLNNYAQQQAVGTSASAAQPPQNTQDQSANGQNNVVATLTSNDQNSSTSALTYNASGLLSRFQQAVPQSASSDTEQAARDAILNTQNAITQAQGSFEAGQSSNNSSAIDTVAQFGQSEAPKTGESSQSAQAAIAQAQYAKNQALNNLSSNSTAATA